MRLALALVLLSGCATGETTIRRGDVEVRTFRRAYTNAHVVTRAGVSVMVDAGYDSEAAALDAQLRKAGVDPARLAAIVVTHAHADHTGGAAWFKQRYGTRIIAGTADRAAYAGGHNEKLCPTGALGKWRFQKDRAGTFPPLVADTWIDGPTSLLPLAGLDATIVPVPSHTPGSLAVIVGDVALVGDLFRGSLVGHAAEIHFFMCDLAANRADVQRLLAGNDLRLFFTGHFGPIERPSVERRFAR